MKIGAHVSTAGGYSKAVERVAGIDGNCLQIFSTSPRGWRSADPSEEEREKFLNARKEFGVDPVYFHASYLINLAGTKEIQAKSIDSLVAELDIADRFNISGSIVHLGSYKNGKEDDGKDPLFKRDPGSYNELLENMEEILKRSPKDVSFIIENMGTRKVGKDIEEIAFIIESLNDGRVKVCLDTCHLHAAGHDLSSQGSLDGFLSTFDELIGLDLLEVIHMNDSKDELGSLRDRHDNIAEGNINKDTFSLLLNHDKLKDKSFIIEVPGMDGEGPDKENIERLKSLLK